MYSSIEDIVYEAHSRGLKDELFVKVGELRLIHPRKQLSHIYEQAFSDITTN
jgi:hypothetical protein